MEVRGKCWVPCLRHCQNFETKSLAGLELPKLARLAGFQALGIHLSSSIALRLHDRITHLFSWVLVY